MNDVEYDFSKNGFLTMVWGPIFWFILHIISFNYPVFPTNTQKSCYFYFFSSIQYVLPCATCRYNLTDIFTSNDTNVQLNMKHFKNRTSLSVWVYNLHCKVNDSLSKSNDMTFVDVQKFYEQFRSKCTNSKSHIGCVYPLGKTKSKCLIQIVNDDD